MRTLTETEALYGKVQVIFVGNFFQIPPVMGVPLVQEDIKRLDVMNRSIFLKRNIDSMTILILTK